MKFKAILFDLDGTLLDTLQDLANCANFALSQLGFPQHKLEQYRFFVGDGVENLMKRILPKDSVNEYNRCACLEIMNRQYSKRWNENTKPYAGIPDLLDALTELNYPMAVLSNKPDNFTKLTAAKLLGDWQFKIVLGAREHVPLKPDPTAALEIADKINTKPAEILYVGDTNTDIQTANASGMYAAGALWGFRDAGELKANGAKVLIEKPLEILDILQN